MALNALCRGMPAGQRKVRRCMIECCRSPGSLCMTCCAIVTELPLKMIRVCRLIEIRRVTIEAGMRQSVLVVHMTLTARYGLMRTG
jgi:hypothetical protein